MSTTAPNAPTDVTDLLHDGDFGSKVLTMTPEAAQRWLDEINTQNRPLSAGTVRLLASAIEAGGWKLTHQGIALDTDLSLLDGQHRLAAIAQADTPVPVYVSWGLERDTFAVIDTNRRRTAADVIGMSDLDIPNRHIASAISRLLNFKAQGGSLSDATESRTYVSNAELLAVIDSLGEDRVAQASRIGQHFTKLGGTSVGVFAYDVLGSGAPEDLLVSSFLTPIEKGIGLMSDRDPRYAAKAYIERAATGKRTAKVRAEVSAMLTKAWNSWVQGEERKVFKTPSEFVDAKPVPAGFSVEG